MNPPDLGDRLLSLWRAGNDTQAIALRTGLREADIYNYLANNRRPTSGPNPERRTIVDKPPTPASQDRTTLTRHVFGDPPIGRSALDKERA